MDKIEVISPLDGMKIGEVAVDVDISLKLSKAIAAWPQWRDLGLTSRAQIFYRYRELFIQSREELANLISKENGKTHAEAQAELNQALEMIEYACSLPQVLRAESRTYRSGVRVTMERIPLGVVASVSPFNFPQMIPHWTMPLALMLGNVMLAKPSELVPLSSELSLKLLLEAGLPEGVLQLVHGGREVVEALCVNPEVSALSFVGSTAVAKSVYRQATQALKPCLCLGGAKNHLLVLADAEPETCVQDVLSSMTAVAGQRCMATATFLGVGAVDGILNNLVAKAEKLRFGEDLGALVSEKARNRVIACLDRAEKEGARFLLDGRKRVSTAGFYLGPSILEVEEGMSITQEEVFGPVLAVRRVRDLDEALDIQRGSVYGNSAGVYTQNLQQAEYALARLNAGMLGVNVAVPVPHMPFSFGGERESKFGSGDINGESGIHFWTRLRKTSALWRSS